MDALCSFQCSASCGGGIRTRAVVCKRADTNEEVPLAACQGTPPETEEMCNTEECPMGKGKALVRSWLEYCAVPFDSRPQELQPKMDSFSNMLPDLF